MQPSTFDVIERRKSINMFKLGKVWAFKYFFDDKEIFKALSDHYNKDLYRFEFKTAGERNKALKLLYYSGFDVQLVEDLKGFVVKISKFKKYVSILKNSVAHTETKTGRIFLMRDLAAVEEALVLGTEIYDGENPF